ncbi:MAG: ABC transporter ATP-binding protein [Lachnospiraceae bacterium]|nr:ABC transporter ATP-binding protein [Lachnospiraceae bacterium]
MTIEAENVSKAYDGKQVLKDFSLEISSDSCYALTGPEGCGKTTFIRIVLGLEKPDSGRIRLLGDYKYAWINAGVVFQDDRLCEDFSAVDNVAMVNKKLSPRIARQELCKLLPDEMLDKPVKELDKSMRRRVCIIRACAIPTDVILMDEPFEGMDAATRTKSIEYIKSIKATTPVVITAKTLEGLEFCKNIPIPQL